MGLIADTLQASLRELAASDARLYRGLDRHLRTTKRHLAALEATEPSTEDQITAAIALLERHGFTVTR